jgi:transposase InsO family protein
VYVKREMGVSSIQVSNKERRYTRANAVCTQESTPEHQGILRFFLRAHRGYSPREDRFIEGFYNPHRRHSALDYESPAGYETKRAESFCSIASG